MNVYAIANQLHLDLGMVEGGAYHTGFPMGKGQHSVEQVGSLPCACRIGGVSGVVVGGGVAQRNSHAVVNCSLDELHGARLLAGQRHQFYQTVCGYLKPMEHGGVRDCEGRRPFCAPFFAIQRKGPSKLTPASSAPPGPAAL